MQEDSEYLTGVQAADYIGVSYVTLLKLIEQGVITAAVTQLSGNKLYWKPDLEQVRQDVQKPE